MRNDTPYQQPGQTVLTPLSTEFARGKLVEAAGYLGNVGADEIIKKLAELGFVLAQQQTSSAVHPAP